MSCCAHFIILLKKNFILWKRNWVQSLLEIIIPVIIAIVFGSMKYIVGTNDIAAASFTSNLYDLPTVIDSTWVPYQMVPTATGTEQLIPKLKNCPNSDTEGNTIALVPNNALTQAIKSQLEIGYQKLAEVPSMKLSTSQISFKFFDTRQAMLDEINNPEFSVTRDSFCYAIVFNASEGTGKYNYELMFNTSVRGDSDFVDPSLNPIDLLTRENIELALIKYHSTGFLTLQSIINNLLVQDTYGDTNAKIEAKIQSVGVPEYFENKAAKSFITAGDVFLAFPLLWPFLRYVAYLIEDKERRIKEGMTMMGMSETAFFFSYFVFYLVIFTVIAILSSIFMVTLLASGTSWIIFFVWYWLFSISLMAVAYFCSAFFSRVRPGTIVALIVFEAFFFLKSLGNLEDAPLGRKMLLGFFAPTCNLYMGQEIILSLSAIGSGLTSSTIGTKYNNISMGQVLMLSILSSIFYYLLGAYIERVWPRQYGIRKHPLYCFTCCCKRRNNRYTEKVKPLYQEENPSIEPVDEAIKLQDTNGESLIIRELRKVYSSGKVAVDGISMTMYKGQIFSLLGHNGAGKTSLISVLTGLYPASSGRASIFGHDIATDMDKIRKRLGVCPQHDILFPKLTIREHLRLFATFKGMTGNIEEEIDKIIKDLDLWEKRDDFAKNLSGGQKRRLSIGIALIGKSDIILLDEPSSGMDTSARRSLWEMLKNYKNDRIIILTTHFMDEADFLGDRIGIMGKGKLLTCGRSLFLKNKFGVGYTLTLVKRDPMAPAVPIINLIKKHIPEATILSNVSAELGIQLPVSTTPKFSGLFQELDSLKESLGVSGYGISITTLEEVFLKVAEIDSLYANDSDKKKPTPQKNNLIVEMGPSSAEQSLALQQGEPEAVSLNKVQDLDENDQERIEGKATLLKAHFIALLMKKWHYFKRDKKGLIREIFLPIIIMIIGLAAMRAPLTVKTPAVPLNPVALWPQPVNVRYNTHMPDTTAVSTNLVSLLGKNVTLISSNAQTLTAFDTEITNNAMTTDPSLRMAYFIEKDDVTTYQWSFTALVNTTARQAAPLAINYMSSTILQQKDPSNFINQVLTSLPKTGVQNERRQGVLSGVIAVNVFTMGLSFIAASLIFLVVKETESNAKHQQIVSGVSISAYWMSNYLVDFLKYLLPGIIGPLLVIAFDISALKDNGAWSATWALFLLFGPANISFAYALSFLFKTAGGGQIAGFFINMCIGILGASLFGTLRLFDTTAAAAKGVAWIFRIFPTYCFADGLFVTTSRDMISYAEGWYPAKEPLDINLAGADILFLGIDAVGYLLLVFLFEYFKSRQITFSRFFGKEASIKYEAKPWDDDVENENLRVAKSENDKFNLKVKEVRKVFMLDSNRHKVAVDKISFGVEQGEVFALLGVNGAGKTTTFKMMSGEIAPTEGKVFIKGFDISQDLRKAQQFIGYCPQFDALLDFLTAKEHLELFAAIKGIPVEKRKRMIDQKIKDVGLEPFKNIPAGTYSGGNKRKLSFAIATIGNPPIVFLDEPSTGMDPESRRFMWSVISNISTKRKMSSIVLTTHSMEEAEALSTRIAIQVDGLIKCLGSAQHIKNKFGGGYEMEFKLAAPERSFVQQTLTALNLREDQIITKTQVEEVLAKMKAGWLSSELNSKGAGSAIFKELEKESLKAKFLVEFVLTEKNGEELKKFLRESLGDVFLIEHFQTFYRFKVITNVGIGIVFGKIEEKLKELNIAQYSVGQTTIEQIFNLFATGKLPATKQESRSPEPFSQSPELIHENVKHHSSQQITTNPKKELTVY